MSRVEELESKIQDLTSHELSELREWLAEYEAERWDRQFAADVSAGRLDALADRALIDLAENRATDL